MCRAPLTCAFGSAPRAKQNMNHHTMLSSGPRQYLPPCPSPLLILSHLLPVYPTCPPRQPIRGDQVRTEPCPRPDPRQGRPPDPVPASAWTCQILVPDQDLPGPGRSRAGPDRVVSEVRLGPPRTRGPEKMPPSRVDFAPKTDPDSSLPGVAQEVPRWAKNGQKVRFRPFFTKYRPKSGFPAENPLLAPNYVFSPCFRYYPL